LRFRRRYSAMLLPACYQRMRIFKKIYRILSTIFVVPDSDMRVT
jgi:hypothetical protein